MFIEIRCYNSDTRRTYTAWINASQIQEIKKVEFTEKINSEITMMNGHKYYSTVFVIDLLFLLRQGATNS